MARIDDYVQAKELAVKSLAKTDIAQVAQRAGYERIDDKATTVAFLNREYKIDFESFDFKDAEDESKEVPIQEQVLILHYLNAQSFPEPSGNWVSYREIPGATFYNDSFLKRAVVPLKKVFGSNVEGLKKAAGKLDGRPVDSGDASFEFHPFPKVPLGMTVWEGDDEFEPEANIVFDETVGKMLSPEDIAWMAGMVVYRLMALSR